MQEQEPAERQREAVIEVEDLKMSFGGRKVLQGVSFRVTQGQICVVLGRSGSGKSTIVRCLVGADRPEDGRVRLFGKDITHSRGAELDGIRRRFGCVFQAGGLYSSMTIAENVAFAVREHTELDDEMIEIMAQIKLAQVGMQEQAEKMPGELSMGMRKRAAIARALALDPEIMFYDDPTTGLDPVVGVEIDGLVVRLSRKLGVTTLVVTHDVQSAFRIADRVIVLHEGKVIAEGSTDEMKACQVPEVRRFIHGELGRDGLPKEGDARRREEPRERGKGTV